MATATQRAILKTYHGSSMAEALVAVKKDLGAEAVILHTRTYKVGGVLGVGSRDMVEITASSDAGVVRPRRIRPRAGGVFDAGSALAGAASSPEAIQHGFVPTPPWFQPGGMPKPAPTITGRPVAAGSTRDPAQVVELKPVAGRSPPAETSAALVGRPVRPPSDGGDDRPTGQDSDEPRDTPLAFGAEVRHGPRLAAARVTPAPTTPAAQVAVEEELSAIRRLVGQVLQSSRRAEARAARASEDVAPAPSAPGDGPLFDLYMRLLDNQTSIEVADALTSAVRDELTAGELSDAGVVRGAMLRRLARRIAVEPDTKPPTRTLAGRPSVVALIGPTGVGKTTTVAKLAASFKLRHGRRVGLVTADTYRIAAVEQLRTYAEIVGLPMKIALSPRDMADAVDALSDCDVVLVDTAGRSQHDAARLDELGEFLDAARPDASHLVLSLAAAESVIFAAAERFGAINPRRLILSKLDEAVDFGVIANIAAKVRLPLSYLTTGQEVPDHLEPACADRLARLVLDGRAAWKVSTRGA